MIGFQFTASCECGGELNMLTRSQPDPLTSSVRVVCRSCGSQWNVDVVMTRRESWSEFQAREGTQEGLFSVDSKGRTR